MEGVRFSYSERGEILHVIRAGVLVRAGAPDDGEDSDVIHVSNGFTMYIEGDENTHQAQLSASRGKLDEAAMRLVAEDDVVLKNTDGDRLETEYLVWAHDSDRVHTDRPVAIYTSNGVIFGKGLESDARFESYRILQPSGEIPIDLSSR
jgi:LPS export ABC transporter protein LptC